MRLNALHTILNYAAILTLLALSAAGCTHTHTMTPNAHADFYSEVEAASRERVGRIRLTNGDEQTGVRIKVTADSISWMNPDPVTRVLTRRKSLPTSDVREITVINHKKGAVIGAAIGAMVGFGFGALPTLDNPSGRKYSLSRRMLMYGGLFGAVAILGGAAAGYKRPARDIYVFGEDLEGSQSRLLAQQLKGAQIGVDEVIERLRKTIAGIDPNRVKEEITAANIVYRVQDVPFCLLSVEGRRVNIYLSARQQDISDPQGLLRRWSTNDSWFSITPGGDYEYAISLIRQALQRIP